MPDSGRRRRTAGSAARHPFFQRALRLEFMSAASSSAVMVAGGDTPAWIGMPIIVPSGHAGIAQMGVALHHGDVDALEQPVQLRAVSVGTASGRGPDEPVLLQKGNAILVFTQ